MPLGPDLLAAAGQLAVRAHDGQVDKAGAPYIGHPRRVADRVRRRGGDVAQQAAALLHDVLEDSSVTVDDLRHAGMPEPVVTAVVALTRRPGEPHEDAVARAAADPVAQLVKRCDLEDNTDPDRLARLDSDTRARLEAKYARALAVLDAAPRGGPGRRRDPPR